jgi:hypothetical protein
MHFICFVGISRGISALTTAQFEWQRNDEAPQGRVTLSYGAEHIGLQDAQIRQVISRERVRDAVMLLVGQDSAGYPPVLVLHLRDADPLQIKFSQYTNSPPCDWRSVLAEIVSAWGSPTAGFAPVCALGPPALTEDAIRAMRQQQVYVQGPAALSSFQRSVWEGPMPSHGTTSDAHGPHALIHPPLHVFGDTALAGHVSIGDEGAIAHAIVLFISHARVSKDCRGGRSRKAYRSHMTHTALAAMCAAAEAVVAADLNSARAVTDDAAGRTPSIDAACRTPSIVELPAEGTEADSVREVDLGTPAALPPLDLLPITALTHPSEAGRTAPVGFLAAYWPSFVQNLPPLPPAFLLCLGLRPASATYDAFSWWRRGWRTLLAF